MIPVKGNEVSDSPLATLDDSVARGRCVDEPHLMMPPLDAEKYRWIRANRGNFAIVEALNGSDRDSDFDERIEAEMRMCAAGKDSYRSGARRFA
jgi:hypothetical protein